MLAVIFLLAFIWWDLDKKIRILESQNKQHLLLLARLAEATSRIKK